MSDSDRIADVKFFTRLSYPKLAERIGLKTPQTFYDIKSGKNKISKDLASKIIKEFPSISFEWLVNGTGDMLRSGDSQIAFDIEGTTAQASGAESSATINASNADLIAIIARYQEQIIELQEAARKERELLLAEARAERERLYKLLER